MLMCSDINSLQEPGYSVQHISVQNQAIWNWIGLKNKFNVSQLKAIKGLKNLTALADFESLGKNCKKKIKLLMPKQISNMQILYQQVMLTYVNVYATSILPSLLPSCKHPFCITWIRKHIPTPTHMASRVSSAITLSACFLLVFPSTPRWTASCVL